jgi:hypothetical protein
LRKASEDLRTADDDWDARVPAIAEEASRLILLALGGEGSTAAVHSAPSS